MDFQALNKMTKKDRYPLPLLTDLLDAPQKARVYTHLDLRHAYHLVRIAEGVMGRIGRETGVGGSEESRSWVNGIHGRG